MSDNPWALCMVTDFGTIRLSSRMEDLLRAEADSLQHQYWVEQEDDLIGVPEVEPFNNAIERRANRRARELWEAGLPVEYTKVTA